MNPTSAAARRQLIGMATAPRWFAATIVVRNSMLLYERMPTTSPRPNPSARRLPATAAPWSSIAA